MADSLFAVRRRRAQKLDPLWQLGHEHEFLGVPAFSSRNVAGNNGILATPVVGPELSGTVYVVSRDCDPKLSAGGAALPAADLFAIGARERDRSKGSASDGGQRDRARARARPRSSIRFALEPVRAAACSTAKLRSSRSARARTAARTKKSFAFHGWLFGYSGERSDQSAERVLLDARFRRRRDLAIRKWTRRGRRRDLFCDRQRHPPADARYARGFPGKPPGR